MESATKTIAELTQSKDYKRVRDMMNELVHMGCSQQDTCDSIMNERKQNIIIFGRSKACVFTVKLDKTSFLVKLKPSLRAEGLPCKVRKAAI